MKSVYIFTLRNKQTNKAMSTVNEVLAERNERGIIAFSANGWSAISREGTFMIMFNEGEFPCSKNDTCYKFYKNEKSWAKRVVGLMKRGY
jgi:hypothetical protein